MLSRTSAIILFLFLAVCLPYQAPVFASGFIDNYVDTIPHRPEPPILLQDASGQTLNLKDFRGRFILLNLWTSWCAPCVSEMPSLDALQKKLGGENFTVIALNEEHDGTIVAKNFYNRYGIQSLGIYSDPSGRGIGLVLARGLPVTLLINAQGNEIGRVNGDTDWDSPEAIALIKSAMAAAP